TTDGQVLVWHDMLGLQTTFHPKFLKQFAQGNALFVDALNTYVKEVQEGNFPGLEHTF
ncbi:MAG: 3-methyl-2-oxobutanoate hydroxymethyltransferase, partial [bacterium]|nr:3-methyl-2-oxobutanoate hydroxymethyltransferase [bacterium]